MDAEADELAFADMQVGRAQPDGVFQDVEEDGRVAPCLFDDEGQLAALPLDVDEKAGDAVLFKQEVFHDEVFAVVVAF